ncbi:MAG: hypothetical protein AB4426_25360 [Xenococcaceae cyanobacterium]
MEKLCKYTLVNGLTADAIQVHNFVNLSDALRKLGFHRSRPTLVLVGGASRISNADLARLQQLFVEVLAPIAESLGATVVDGGTDAGIMRLIGQARAEIGATFPLIGVAAVGTVILPGVPPPCLDAVSLAPQHTHFVLVPGHNWGDESPWLARISSILSNGCPSITLAINGGEITWQDVSLSIKEGRLTIVLAGSGRTADKLAAALRGEATDERATELVASGLLQAIDMNQDSEVLAEVIQQMLST